MAEILKETSPAVFKVATGIWTKSLESEALSPQQSENPTYPYIISKVEQYQPTREMIEKFEVRRTQLENSMPQGKKLETINCFYNPASEGLLRKILANGWAGSFDAVDVSFYSSAAKAIQETAIPYHKLIVCRVCLGRDGVDYTLANGRYRLRDLSGVQSSFLFSYRNALAPNQTPPTSPFKMGTTNSPQAPESSISSPSVKSTASPSRPTHVSGQLAGNGLVCPSCNRENAGNTRYCVRCGGHL
eukprot:gene7704-9021_t